MNDIIAVCVFAHQVSSEKIPGVSRCFSSLECNKVAGRLVK